MIVCYAQGGGLGHLTRIRAFLHTVYPDRAATVLTGSPFAADPRVTGPHQTVHPPTALERAELASWLRRTLDRLAPTELVVDAFPAGLAGELSAEVVPPGTRTVIHLARLLRWSAYRDLVSPQPVRFDRTWCVEPLTAEHREYLTAVSAAVAPLSLVEPPIPGRTAADVPASGAWLIVHAGPDAEIMELVGYAQDTADLEGVRPDLILVSPCRPAQLPHQIRHLPAYPAWPLFEHAERIVTAAGCNVVRQLAPWRTRHRMVPFPRRFDDQFTRATRERSI